jgi:hypothetical protein
MKLRLKLTGLTLTLLAIAGLAVSLPAHAANQGQIASGDIYRSKNVTKGSDFSNTTTADACESLQYKVRLHNPGPGIVHQVHVAATLPAGAATSNTSTVTITAADADPATVSDSTVVNLSSSQSIAYTSGTTQLLDANNNILKSLPDGITQGGVDIGDVGVSLNEIRFVQFMAKVSCPAPAQPAYACTNLSISAEERTVKITNFTTSQSGGATFKNADVNWGDNSSVLTTANVVGQTHTYASAGTFTIVATARFTVNGQEVTASSPACTAKVTFAEKSQTPPTVVNSTNTPASPSSSTPSSTQPGQPKPTTLVDTGAGSLTGLFAAVTVASTLSYRWFLTRKLAS